MSEVTLEDRINQLAVLVRAAIGSSSLENFSKRSGISVGTLSRMQKGKIKNIPKRKTLEAIIAAKPENAIALNDLLAAAGYEQQSNQREGLPVAQEGRSIPEEIIHRSGSKLIHSAVNTALFLFINYLFQGKEDYHFSVSRKSTYFQLETSEYEYGFLGIPAFVGDKDNQVLTKQIMATILYNMQYAKDEDSVIVITDSQDIYNSLIGVFRRFKGKVLLTKDYDTVENNQ